MLWSQYYCKVLTNIIICFKVKSGGTQKPNFPSPLFEILATEKQPAALLGKNLVRISVWKLRLDMCVPVYTEQEVIEEVWLSPRELPAAQWELCYYWTKHLISSSCFLSKSFCLSRFSLSSFAFCFPLSFFRWRKYLPLSRKDAVCASPRKLCTKEETRFSFFSLPQQESSVTFLHPGELRCICQQHLL